jgi:DNA-binding transcriptional LysR family regulator
MQKRADIDWKDLRYFVWAVRSGSLAAAARALEVEHSTIGRRLSSLERTLGGALVTRRPDGLRLTPLGEQVLPLAEEAERAVLAVQDLAAARPARVRLAVPSGFSRLLAQALGPLGREHPGLALELVSGSRPVDLRLGEADLAIRSGPVQDQDLVARKIGEARWSLYASDACLDRRPAPADPRRLAGHEVLGFAANLASVPGAAWIAEHGAAATIVLESRELADMLAAAAGGLGLTILPCMLAACEPGLRQLTDEVLGRSDLWLVHRRGALMSPSVQAVARFVLRFMRQRASAFGDV